MRLRLLVSLLAVVLLIVSCFLPWMIIESKGIIINGINTKPTSYGVPALFHFVWAGIYILFLLLNKVWANRVAVGIAGFNIAWALRNFLMIPACSGGECPQKRLGLYLLLITSIVMFILPLIERNVAGTTPGTTE